MTRKPQLYIIAGPNGVGKTTWAETFLPEFAECTDFLNADMIAKGFSPFAPEKFAYSAGKMFIKQIEAYAKRGQDFAFETTLSGKAHALLLKKLRKAGYTINMFYFWVPGVKLAMTRIEERVRHGGHNIPEKVSLRRYNKSLNNLFNIYLPLIDYLEILDNSERTTKRVAVKNTDNLIVYNTKLYTMMRSEYFEK